MPPKPQPFRLVYRSFPQVAFDRAKSEQVFRERGFDLAYASRLFPGYVLEREDTRADYGERRFKVIGELLGDVLVLMYTPRGCTLPEARPAVSSRRGWPIPSTGGCGMDGDAEATVVVDQSDPNRGRIDRSRFGKRDVADAEAYPVTRPEDAEATLNELAELRRRLARKSA